MTSKLILAFLVSVSFAMAQEQDRISENIVTARVTDRENAPIEGAAVYKLNWFEDPKDNPPPVFSDSLGNFKFRINPSSPDSPNYVIIHRNGFGFGALWLDALPARARLYPGRSIALRILDPKGEYVNGARVIPGEIAFDDEPLIAMIPRKLAQETGTVTGSNGWATLRSIRPSTLRTLVVETDGYGAQIFPCNFEKEAKFHKLQLQDTEALKLVLKKGEVPAVGWKVLCRGRDQEAPRKNPEEFIHATGVLADKVADATGNVLLEHVLAEQDIDLTLIDNTNEYRGTVKIKSERGRKQPIEVQVPKSLEEVGQEKHAQVVDVQSGGPVAGFHLTFVCNAWPDMRYNAVSDEQGMLNLKLLPGIWHIHVEKAQSGYCNSIISAHQVVAKDKVGERLASIPVAKAKELTGVIRGIELDLHRARWIKVHWTNGNQKQGDTYGVVHPDGTFHATIPVFASAEEFSIARRFEHDGKLRVESQDPLVLTGE